MRVPLVDAVRERAVILAIPPEVHGGRDPVKRVGEVSSVDVEVGVDGHDLARGMVLDLLGGGRHFWRGARSFVELVFEQSPAHVLANHGFVRGEPQFEYFL